MQSNTLLVVPESIARLAIELSQSQWFFDDTETNFDSEKIKVEDIAERIVNDIKREVLEIDLLLSEISPAGSLVKKATVIELQAKLQTAAQNLKRFKHSLTENNLKRTMRDVDILIHDYGYLRDQLRRWLRQRRQDSDYDDTPKGGSRVLSGWLSARKRQSEICQNDRELSIDKDQ